MLEEAAGQPEKWYEPYVSYVLEHGFMEHLEDGDFGAEEPMTRAMFVSALYKIKFENAEAAENTDLIDTDPDMVSADVDADGAESGENQSERDVAGEGFSEISLEADSCREETGETLVSDEMSGIESCEDLPVSASEMFGDVTGEEWFVPALEWAVENVTSIRFY